MEEERSTPLMAKSASGLPALQFAMGGSVPVVSNAGNRFVGKVWRAKWSIVTAVVGCMLIALMLGAVQSPLYKVQTSIELQSPGSTYQHAKVDGASSQNAADLQPLESYLQTQIRLIQSRSLAERILSKLSAAERARLVETPRFWWNHPASEQGVGSITKHITARPSEPAGIVDIDFLSPDPVAGAHFLNLMTQELGDLNIERSWHAAQRSREWTDRQLAYLRRKWEQSELALAEQSSKTDQNKDRIIQPLSGKAHTEALSDLKLQQLKNHLADLNKQIAKWQSLYGPSTPTLTALKSQAAATDIAIRQRRAALSQNSPAVPPVKGAAPVVGLPLPTGDQTQTAARINILKQDADSNRRVYEATAARLMEASVAESSHIGDINVVDPAIVVTKPTYPRQLRNGLLGALCGLIFGVSFIGLRDHFSHTFSGPGELSQHLGLDVMGAIPADRFRAPEKGFTTWPGEPILNLTFDKDARTAEAFRSIRSSVLLRTGDKPGPRRLTFTSAGEDEGKTSVVGNLGAALASAQRRVLLIDGDLRTPGLHNLFGTDNEHGLADLLSNQIGGSPVASRDVIRATQVPDLYLLSAGQAGDQAPEILSSRQLPQLIREFAKGFDIVLIDSPPVLPYADARSLAHASDAVILVVKADSTNRRSALLARDAIAQDGAPIIGAILTDWNGS